MNLSARRTEAKSVVSQLTPDPNCMCSCLLTHTVHTALPAYVRTRVCLCEQTEDGEVVDEDVAHLYQSRIAQQKAELEALVAQKKELLQLRDMLRQLQVQETKVRTYVHMFILALSALSVSRPM